jgi:hypothetical protein
MGFSRFMIYSKKIGWLQKIAIYIDIYIYINPKNKVQRDVKGALENIGYHGWGYLQHGIEQPTKGILRHRS